MDQNKQQIIERLTQATNVLVTVSANPSVDQLAACIGLTLFLNKLGKHATAVFSGQAPSAIEFLEPETTLEQNTDSLRDFIISLDKSKADKLRYKVEENIVKIFITPYRTSLSDADLNFSQGDFNVEAVVALGVQEKEDLDQAITSHGRILHDATVMSVNTTATSALGSINWSDPSVSSLCEMVTGLTNDLKKDGYDNQIATALLTGIVAETERFSNEKTSPNTMTLAATLMGAGANQQLIATKLQPKAEEAAPLPQEEAVVPEQKTTATSDGALSINHDEQDSTLDLLDDDIPDIHIDEHGNMNQLGGDELPPTEELRRPDMILEPPSRGGELTANDKPEQLAGSADAMSSVAPLESILQHNNDEHPEPMGNTVEEDPLGAPIDQSTPPVVADSQEASQDSSVVEPETQNPEQTPAVIATAIEPSELPSSIPDLTPLNPEPTPDPATVPEPVVLPEHDSVAETLAELEKTVDSLHLESPEAGATVEPAPDASDARSAVESALNASTDTPLQSLNAQPLSDGSLHEPASQASIVPTPIGDILAQADAEAAEAVEAVSGTTAPDNRDPAAPPPLPPPLTIMPPIPGEGVPITDSPAPPTNPLFNPPS